MIHPRLQKFLADRGLGSRREIERWIKAGRIKLNDRVAQLGDCVSEKDRIVVDGKLITHHVPSEKKFLIFHKPVGVICTRSDPQGRPTVFDYLPQLKKERWVMIGRLDVSTSGLLLFTNDGELANYYMHPSSEIEREYKVRVLGEMTPQMLMKLKKGIRLEDGMARFDSIKCVNQTGANRWYHVVLKEGRNREVRRLFESQQLTVSRLMRIRFGNIKLPRDLKPGECRFINFPKLPQPIQKSK